MSTNYSKVCFTIQAKRERMYTSCMYTYVCIQVELSFIHNTHNTLHNTCKHNILTGNMVSFNFNVHVHDFEIMFLYLSLFLPLNVLIQKLDSSRTGKLVEKYCLCSPYVVK